VGNPDLGHTSNEHQQRPDLHSNRHDQNSPETPASVGVDHPPAPERAAMQVDELLMPFPIKEFHPFPRGLLGPGAHELIGP